MVLAQRGGVRGGGGGGSFHSAPSGGHVSSGAAGGGRPSGMVSRPAVAARPADARPSYPRTFGPRPSYGRSPYRPTAQTDRAANGENRGRGNGASRTYRRRVGYGYIGYPYSYPGYGYYGDFFPWDWNDPDDPNLQSANQENYVSSGYAGDQQADAGPYNGPYDDGPNVDGPPDMARPAYNGASSEEGDASVAQNPTVALIFKDGRRLEIRNYVATHTRILVRDPGVTQDILVSMLDMPATMAANQAAGVDFSLPGY